MNPSRAFILLKSGRRLDLLKPEPDAWTDEDLAVGLSRTYRWGGHSAWDLPLSVAQHSLTVLALREAEGPLSAREALRELLHDATEALFGGFDPIAPLKPHLGPAFQRLDRRLQSAVDRRYGLPAWTEEAYLRHKRADRLAAASEACHVVGWSREDLRDSLDITLRPLGQDPLPVPPGRKPWEPWPPALAARVFHARLQALIARAEPEIPESRADLGALFGLDAHGGAKPADLDPSAEASSDRERLFGQLALAFARLPETIRARCKQRPAGTSRLDTLVYVEAGDHSQAIEGVIVDGEQDENGAWLLDAEFTVFSNDANPRGELIRVHGYNCHVEIL